MISVTYMVLLLFLFLFYSQKNIGRSYGTNLKCFCMFKVVWNNKFLSVFLDTKLLTFIVLVVMVAKIRLPIGQNIGFAWDIDLYRKP